MTFLSKLLGNVPTANTDEGYEDWGVDINEEVKREIENNPYHFGVLAKRDIEKANPAQEQIAAAEGSHIYTTKFDFLYNQAYAAIEVVGRGTDLLIDSSADINYDVKDGNPRPAAHKYSGIKKKTVHNLLNYAPNPHMDKLEFRTNIFIDLVLEGNAFIYFDGAHLYNLPSTEVQIITDKKTFVKGYQYHGITEMLKPYEVIHIKDNSVNSIYRGDSRLACARKSILVLLAMLDYQENFFKNGAVPGLVLKTKDVLSPRIKERIVRQWQQKYNPRSGGKRPAVLDGGMEVDTLNSSSFKELEFTESITSHENRILKALGVPPILIDTGNNANITPNLRLFYITTVLPLVKKLNSALERYFGFDIELDTSKVIALQPELKELQEYYTGLTNNGILLGKEAREALRLPPIDDPLLDKIRIPQNIAGSATGVDGQEGGRPSNEE